MPILIEMSALFQSVKLRTAERPQSLNIVRNSGSVVAETVLPTNGGGVPVQQTQGGSTAALRSQAGCDIVEQSLRAANVLTDYHSNIPGNPSARTGAASLSQACTAASTVAASVTHPLGQSTVDYALDYSQQQQQRLNSRRFMINNNNNNMAVMSCGRHSLSDIMTPTSDVTTASSPSETLSQVCMSHLCLCLCLCLSLSLFALCVCVTHSLNQSKKFIVA